MSPPRSDALCGTCAPRRTTSTFGLAFFRPKRFPCRFEELYHPDRYKLSFCRNRAGGCALGTILCAFAHEPTELRRPLIDVNEFKKNGQLVQMYLYFYKTEPCPYKNETHHYPHCIYYHNAVDFRR